LSQLALVEDTLFVEHVASETHPERPERLTAVHLGVEGSGIDFCLLEPRDATAEELLRVHTPGYLEELQGIAGRRGHLDVDTFHSPASYAATLRASGGVVALVEALMSREHDYGFACVRPPGHHALAERAMGFCIVNHVAVGARHALSLGAHRVAIVDWDVHHGNGTEAIFEDDPDVLFISLHQRPLYPGTGHETEVGSGQGLGKTVNVPLSAAANDAVCAAAFERVVLPILRQFAPDFVIVSAGFDAHQRDPLGGMAFSERAYSGMTSALAELLPERGKHRLLFSLEGGYDLQGLEEGVRGTCSGLLGQGVFTYGQPVAEPWRAEIESARDVQTQYWELPSG
jgi:acetoin utilization deacetylase AcuC-like enzyme